MKSQLINDALSLLQANLIEPENALNISKSLKDDQNYFSWIVFIPRIAYLINMIDTTSLYGSMQSLFREITASYYEKLGWEDNKQNIWNDRYLKHSLD
jgi:hypothetical protein